MELDCDFPTAAVLYFILYMATWLSCSPGVHTLLLSTTDQLKAEGGRPRGGRMMIWMTIKS